MSPGPFGRVRRPTTEGTWAKVGGRDKVYRYENGAEVYYDHNAFRWRIKDDPKRRAFGTLTDAQYEVEHAS